MMRLAPQPIPSAVSSGYAFSRRARTRFENSFSRVMASSHPFRLSSP